MIGKRLKEKRLERKLTQKQLSDALNISTSSIGMYETNKREPRHCVLIKIADYLGVSIDYLTGQDYYQPKFETAKIIESNEMYLELIKKLESNKVSDEKIKDMIKEIEKKAK
ncbi:helix-turn-helix transcriptional regulator [Clostridiaceae bacterium M8S5]|nr:helix-turn-helix transcriptional regulator [Clostridiaceae bacterium M8S5]